MQPADRPEFARILTGLAAIKPGSKLTPEALGVWWLAMQAWAIADFRDAAAHLARSCEFMPSPYQFEQLRKAGRQTAGEAWAEALDAVRGSNYPTAHPALERVIRAIGGWHALAMTTDDGLPFLERRFCEHYDAMQNAQDVREAVPQIAATHRPLLANTPLSASFLLTKLTREAS